MSSLEFTTIESEKEYKEAYQIAVKIFTPSSSSNTYEDYKRAFWVNDPFFSNKNIFVAKHGNKIIGLVRIVPRLISIQSIQFKLAGISSVCILPEYQGKGISLLLMENVLEYAIASGYELSALFARRSADYYYNKFGFFGLASYSKVILKKNSYKESEKKISFADISINEIAEYSNAYINSYEKCSGYITRTLAYWSFLLGNLTFKSDIVFRSIQINSKSVGYVVFRNSHIYELAIQENSEWVAIVDFLTSELCSSQDSELTVNALPQHSLIPYLSKRDVTYQMRECYFGGHMVRILDIESVIQKVQGDLNQLNFSGKFLNYIDTCKLLKVWTPSLNQKDHLPFDICEMDHF